MAEIIGNNIIKIMKVDSTNNYASEKLVKNGCEEGTVVYAGEQSCGRGQLNNKWESEPLKNILFSIVLYPEFLPIPQQFLLSKVVALGLADVVSMYVDEVTIKWPNDIYIGNKKIAGILIENAIMGNVLGSSVVGIGLNINQLEYVGGAPNPVSLASVTGRFYELEQIFSLLIEAIDKWYILLKEGFVDLINQRYVEQLYRFGLKADYRDKTGVFAGEITGVNEIGQLQIRLLNGDIRTYHFKEVSFL